MIREKPRITRITRMKKESKLFTARKPRKRPIFTGFGQVVPRAAGGPAVNTLFYEHAEEKNTKNAGRSPPQSEDGHDRPRRGGAGGAGPRRHAAEEGRTDLPADRRAAGLQPRNGPQVRA